MTNSKSISCEEVRNLMGVYLDFDSKLEAISEHFRNCRDCQNVWSENKRLSNMLKHAVELETAPQRSIDRIRKGIRR